MARRLTLTTLVVRDYDEAIRYYTDVLGFQLREDTILSPAKRWVVIAPMAEGGNGLLLARAATLAQRRIIGNQAGGRVFLFLETDEFHADYLRYLARGVRFERTPRRGLRRSLWESLGPDRPRSRPEGNANRGGMKPDVAAGLASLLFRQNRS